jgi:integrase
MRRRRQRLPRFHSQAVTETGARPGEILGLRWCDVKGTKVKITRTAVKHKGAWVYGPPKISKARRTVSLTAISAEALRKRKLETQARARATSEVWNDENPVFRGERGVLPDYRSLVRDHFDPHVKRAGLRRLTPYSMRHGHISGLMVAGEAGLTVAHRAGTSLAMIERTYGHTRPKDDEHAAETFEKLRRPRLKLA